ncbi:MAG: glycosyltransferase family 4 protein [Candidatus Methylomirabilota bacterium]|nr:MAG: glycosyltransferase family 4 protein [candidate division NC10 bacterium]
MRGGERCLEAFCGLFPRADLFTLLHREGSVSKAIEERQIRTSAIQRLPFAASCYRYYLPLFPWAIERFKLDGYDLILSSSHCVAKGVKPPPQALHIAYVYTPMRYIWDMQDAYTAAGRMGPVSRRMLCAVSDRLRRWDTAVNGRVDHFIAISHHVADRIRRHYGREAVVIYPPVETVRFHIAERTDDYYLVAGAFAPYKRIDLAIEACNRLRRRLVIVGEGQEETRLRRIAGSTIEFVGWRSDREVADLLSRCRALIFPGEEDFGILPVEAMASGRPVIAYGKGGATETVIPLTPHPSPLTPTGIFFDEQNVEALIRAVELFERSSDRFDPGALRTYALTFDRSVFEKRIAGYIDERFDEWRRKGGCRRPC